jgi:lysophospholipase L1-like esterase
MDEHAESPTLPGGDRFRTWHKAAGYRDWLHAESANRGKLKFKQMPNPRPFAKLKTAFLIAALAHLVSVPANAQLPNMFRPGETILFQGDSITDGNRGRNDDPNHILGHGYVFSIASRYGYAFPNLGLTFINRGVSGNRIDDLAKRWDADTLALKPTVLSILIGINDIVHDNFDPEAAFAHYDRLLQRTKEANPDVRLVLCEPFILDVGMVLKDTVKWHREVQAMDVVVGRLGIKYNAPVVRFQKAFDEATAVAPANHWIWDGIHPTYSGHEIIARAWIQAYNDFYVSPLDDPSRNSAIDPVVNFERDSYDWLHRHDDILDARTQINPDIVMIGDSITHFWGGMPKANQSNGPKAWEATFHDAKVLNMGMGWDRTQNVLWRLDHGEFKGLTPRAVVLNIGTNNLVGDLTARTNTPEEVATGILAVIRKIHELSPSTHITLMAIFPRGFEKGNELDRRITQTNEIVADKVKAIPYVTVLNIGAKLRQPDGSVSPKILFDGTHPTDAGYAIWGKALVEAGVIKAK